MKTTPEPLFSPVVGGPLFQLFRRARLSGDELELLRRRILTITVVVWVPLMLLSALEGHATGGSIMIPFLRDIETHARFLIALPMLVAAELIVHERISPLVQRFLERRIIRSEDLPAFNAAVKSAVRVRNSIVAEVMLLVLVYTVGLWMWRSQIALRTMTWYAQPGPTGLRLNLAGYWYVFVSIPAFQFVLLRWYLRLTLWFRLLWHISRLKLRLTAAHPDRAGGIGFLGASSYAFSPILFAQGTLLSGLIANRVLYEGQSLFSFRTEAVGLVCAMVLFILGPLAMFAPQMMRTKLKSSAEYGLLANRYVFGFEEKWIRQDSTEMGELLGAADIQSLADLGNSYSLVSDMRFVPFEVKDILRLAAVSAAPLVPLALTTFSLEELLSRLINVLV